MDDNKLQSVEPIELDEKSDDDAIEVDNWQDAYADDDDDQQDDYDYGDFCDDEHFDGFLLHSANADCDLLHEEIINFLRMGKDPAKRPVLALELFKISQNSSRQSQLADCIIEFVLTCPPSNVELIQRMQSVQAIGNLWHGIGSALEKAINKALDPEKPLDRIPSRNLCNFIRVLADEKAIDTQNLIIKNTRVVSMHEMYTERLQQVLFNNFGLRTPGCLF